MHLLNHPNVRKYASPMNSQGIVNQNATTLWRNLILCALEFQFLRFAPWDYIYTANVSISLLVSPFVYLIILPNPVRSARMIILLSSASVFFVMKARF